MGYGHDGELMIWLTYWTSYWEAWREWASQKPSFKHPIQYIKWWFSEPKYDYRKENNK